MTAAAALVGDNVLKELLKSFPAKYCYAFAYGSAVFVQKNQEPGKMTDLVFVVDDPVAWHSANLEMNSRHYSSLRWFGSSFISRIQEKMACGVYYNPYCTIDGKVVKYGVISTASLENDLRNWRHLYIAGRLHKPVLDLHPPSTPSLVDSIKLNRRTALRTALLQRGRVMSKFELYHNIAEISYLGDTRMRFAETPEKTKNIVTPLVDEFDRIYTPLLNEIPFLAVTSEGSIAQDVSPMARYKNLIALPIPIQISLVRACFKDPRFVDVEQVLADLSYLPNLPFFIRKAISEVVRGSSIRQTVQGFFSAGVFKSTAYALEKLRKGMMKKRKATQEVSHSNSIPALPPPRTPIVVTEAAEKIVIAPPPAPLPLKESRSPTSNSTSSKKPIDTGIENGTLSSALSAVVPASSRDDEDDEDESHRNNLKLDSYGFPKDDFNDKTTQQLGEKTQNSDDSATKLENITTLTDTAKGSGNSKNNTTIR